MNIVQPIRDMNQVHKIESILKSQNYRDYILFRLGIFSGLRISDILKLKVKDVRNQNYFKLRENKTGKAKTLKIFDDLKKELDQYIKNMADNDYLISSQKYTKHIKIKNPDKLYKQHNQDRYISIPNESSNSPIQRMQAYRIINNAARKAGITEDIGTHTMRKTFGYQFYTQYNDKNNRALAILQQIYNHSTPHMTLRYIGIAQDEVDDLIDNMKW